MKNVYILITALFIGANAKAQIDFESSLTEPETFNNGSEGPDGFDFSPIQLVNYYDTDFSYFTGFAISNVTDNTTPGYMNQYSAYPGSGADNSSAYAVAYSSPKFYSTSPEVSILSFDISNTTYAGLSMLDGDSFGKKFGEDTNAVGEIDGTNGEDFFKVWVICSNLEEGFKDSLEFYLADYRFADDSEDYIIDSWETISLSDFSFNVTSVSMRFESSDIGEFGMNTPAYVAIDNINWEAPVGISETIENNYQVYPNPVTDVMNIEGPAGKITVSNINGKLVWEGMHSMQSSIDFSKLPNGVYMVNMSTPNGTFTKKVIK